MVNKKIQGIKSVSFFLVLLVITALFLFIIGPLVAPIFYGVVFAIVLYPLYRRLASKINKETPSALISIVIAIIVILLLISVIGGFLVQDALTLIETIGSEIDKVAPSAQAFLERVQGILPGTAAERLSQINLREQIVGYTETIARGLINAVQSFTKNIVQVVILSLVAFYSTFYFLKNGERWIKRTEGVMPLPTGDADFLAQRFLKMTRTALKMIFVMGAIQGFLGGLIFWVLGVTAPVFWGVVFALFSLIPGLGHQIIWIPTAIIFFIIGAPVKAVILILYGLLVMGLADDVLRPYLIGRQVKIHPFLILIATIGGIITLGFTGLILGPIVASLTAAVWELYEKRYAT